MRDIEIDRNSRASMRDSTSHSCYFIFLNLTVPGHRIKQLFLHLTSFQVLEVKQPQCARGAARREGAGRDAFLAVLEAAALDEQVGIWRAMIIVLDSGGHRPHHFRGQRP